MVEFDKTNAMFPFKVSVLFEKAMDLVFLHHVEKYSIRHGQ